MTGADVPTPRVPLGHADEDWPPLVPTAHPPLPSPITAKDTEPPDSTWTVVSHQRRSATKIPPPTPTVVEMEKLDVEHLPTNSQSPPHIRVETITTKSPSPPHNSVEQTQTPPSSKPKTGQNRQARVAADIFHKRNIAEHTSPPLHATKRYYSTQPYHHSNRHLPQRRLMQT